MLEARWVITVRRMSNRLLLKVLYGSGATALGSVSGLLDTIPADPLPAVQISCGSINLKNQ